MPLFRREKSRPLDPEVKPVVEAALRVHEALNCGLERALYAEALSIELKHANIAHTADLEFPFWYREQSLRVRLHADLCIDDKLLILVRAVEALNQRDILHLVSVLQASGRDHGILFNFGAPTLEMRRAVAPA